MNPLAIPRRLIWVGVGALAGAGYLYLRHRMDQQREREAKDVTPKREGGAGAATTAKEPGSTTTTSEPATAAPAAEKPGAPPQAGGGARELAEFLAGDSWYDESGWRGIWEREGIADAAAWLRKDGKQVLEKARASLADHPALLAGCRRRWIVVCRYAAIDVSDAATLWNETDVA